MGGAFCNTHPVSYLPCFSVLSNPKWSKPILSLKETANRSSLSLSHNDRLCFAVSNTRADGNVRGSAPGGNEHMNPQSSYDKSPVSPNKQVILSLLKRIQVSISKEKTKPSQKRSVNTAEEKPFSAESILEVLCQPRAQNKGKTPKRKGNKFMAPRSGLPIAEEKDTEQSSLIDLKSTRSPSSFIRRSPIPSPPSPDDKIESKRLLVSDADNELKLRKFEEMKLSELKEIAKSRGIKGYSKLRKTGLVELLGGSGNGV